MNPSLYPSYEQRREFYVAYLKQSSLSAGSAAGGRVNESDIQRLERQVEMWTPASHALWAIWGLVQAREAVENHDVTPEFDYIAHALGRMDTFRRGIKQLGIFS
jgi:choline kinase